MTDDLRTNQAPVEDLLRTRIAAVQAQHHHWDYAGSLTCACGETFGLGVEAGWEAAVAGWAIHVADAVIRELGAYREDGECSYCHAQLPGCRYICDWNTDE